MELRIVRDVKSLVLWDSKAQKEKANTGLGGPGGAAPEKHYPDDISVFVKYAFAIKLRGRTSWGGGVF